MSRLNDRWLGISPALRFVAGLVACLGVWVLAVDLVAIWLVSPVANFDAADADVGKTVSTVALVLGIISFVSGGLVAYVASRRRWTLLLSPAGLAVWGVAVGVAELA